MSRPAGWLRAGRVGRPHGLDGGFYVGEPNLALLEVGASVHIGDRARRIVRRAANGARVVVWLQDCRDRDGAEALRGQQLLAARDTAPTLEADEWWAEDLEGCVVHDHGRRVGMVKRMLTLPSCEVLEVTREADEADLLVPLVRDAVREVDLEHREIDVDLWFLGED